MEPRVQATQQSEKGQHMELPQDVKQTIKRVPQRHREDAEQEAYLAMLEGRDPMYAVQMFAYRELKHEKRELTAQALEKVPKLPRELDMKYLVPSLMKQQDHEPDELEFIPLLTGAPSRQSNDGGAGVGDESTDVDRDEGTASPTLPSEQDGAPDEQEQDPDEVEDEAE